VIIDTQTLKNFANNYDHLNITSEPEAAIGSTYKRTPITA
jgi:hypothetical protein